MEPREVRLGFWLSLFISIKVVYRALSRLRWEVWALLSIYIIAQQVAFRHLYTKFLPRDGANEAWWGAGALSMMAGLAGIMVATLLWMFFRSFILEFLIPGFFEKFEEEALPYQQRELERVDETLLLDSKEPWQDKLK